jgi:hypothetical protein
LLIAATGVQLFQAQTGATLAAGRVAARADVPVVTTTAVPTVAIPQATPLSVPTVSIPRPTATPTRTPRPTPTRKAKPKPVHHRPKPKAKPTQQPTSQWITAFLTSYCPGSAGWLSSSGQTVFYGMLANNYYPFGTRVYIPVIGLTGVVEDHLSFGASWNHFDVWSPVCYSTPTGYYPVAILTR